MRLQQYEPPVTMDGTLYWVAAALCRCITSLALCKQALSHTEYTEGQTEFIFKIVTIFALNHSAH